MANDPILGLVNEPSGDTSWYASYLELRRALPNVAAPGNRYFVSPNFTDANLGDDIANATDRRHYPTIQEAVTAAQDVTGYSSRKVIEVAPGSYSENLNIVGSISIMGVTPPAFAALGAGYGSEVVGNSGTQQPTINITPPSGVSISVGLFGLNLRNLYNQAATAIESGMLVKINSQAVVGTYHNRIFMHGCGLRGQGYGSGNDWLAMVYAHGKNLILAEGCDFNANAYAGGAYNGGCRSLIHTRGDSSAGYTSIVKVRRSTFYHLYNGGQVTTPRLVYADHDSNGWVADSPLYYPVSTGSQFKAGAGVEYGANGTNSIQGLISGEYVDFGNRFGQNLSFVG